MLEESVRAVPDVRRLYRNVKVDGGSIDLLAAEDNIIGYMVLTSPHQLEKALARIDMYESYCNVVFLAHTGLTEEQLEWFPTEWGFIDFSLEASSGMAEVLNTAPQTQLKLLTDAELADFYEKTGLDKNAAHKKLQREELIDKLADAYSYDDQASLISGYLLRRGTVLDTANPQGSVPRPGARSFSNGVTEDAAAMELLQLTPATPDIPQISPAEAPMNRQQRRAAARAAEKKAQNTNAGKKDVSHEPSMEFRSLFLSNVPEPSADIRITDALIEEAHTYNTDLAEILKKYQKELNAFAESHVLDKPAPVIAEANVPEVYVRRRKLYEKLIVILELFYDTCSFMSGMQRDILEAQSIVLAVLTEDDPQVGPDTTEHKVRFEDIEIRPGAPWLSKELIEGFAAYLLYGRRAPVYPLTPSVVYVPSTGSWHMQYSYPSFFFVPDGIQRMESEYGRPDYNGMKVLESLLNLQQPKFKSEEKTAAVIEKQKLMVEEFRKWLSNDLWRRWIVEEEYNKFFSRFEAKTYDGTDLEFPGLADHVRLYPYQKNAVARIMKEKSTLLAFDTGAGKTYIMAAAAMNLRAAGKSTKNLFVVPNTIVGQWEQIFQMMYPTAKLLIVEPKTFTPARRAAILKDIRDTDYDAIIMAYSSFEQIRLSEKEIERQRREAEAPIKKDLKEYSPTDPKVNKARKYLRSLNTEANAVKKSLAPRDGEMTFDQLGITTLFLDEAHNFRNIPLHSSQQKIAGISLKGSKKNLNVLYKVRTVQNNKKWGGTVFATGTPFPDSLADSYTLQRFLQPELMREMHLDVFDNWLKTFAGPETVREIDADASKFRYVNRLSRFYNLPELSRMVAVHTAAPAVDEENPPEPRDYINILIPEDKNLRKYMDELVRRAERIRSNKVPSYDDNMLLISTDGRKAALDLRLVGRQQPDDESSKIYRCTQEVLKVYHEDPTNTQIIFCDCFTPESNKFIVYEDLKQHLIAAGVPQKEIAFIYSATTEAQKRNLYKKVNNGEIRVLIGPTFKLNIGAGLQTKLKAVHHLDAPWHPEDRMQRESSVLHKGNHNDVRIFRYITEGSFDAYDWRILETKQKFISQFLTGTTDERSAADLEDNILAYAQVKALAVNEPLMKTLAEKQNELRGLQLRGSSDVQTPNTRRGAPKTLEEDERRLCRFADRTRANAAALADVDEKTYKALYKTLAELYTLPVLRGEEPLPEAGREVLGFTVKLPPAEERQAAKPQLILSRNDAEYPLPMGDKPAGNARRIINFFKHFDERAVKAEEAAKGANERIIGGETVLQEENPSPAQAAKLTAEIQKLQEEIIGRQQQRAEEALMQPS